MESRIPAKRAKAEDESPPDDLKPEEQSDELKRKKPKPKVQSLELTGLNEDCLNEILVRMKFPDICSMSEVCVRFKESAQQYFRLKYSDFDMSMLAETPNGKFSLLKVRQTLYNFGHLISTMVIDFNQLDNSEDCAKVLALVRKYCFHTIDRLEINNQPNGRMNEYVLCSLLGLELMARDQGPGQFETKSKLSFMSGRSIQTQTLIRTTQRFFFESSDVNI